MASARTILITGCSDGSLGSALALAFRKARWRVLASARNTEKLKKCEEAGIETVQLDTLSDESIASCVAKVKELTGSSVDGLFNNAGAGYNMPLPRYIDRDNPDREINVKAPKFNISLNVLMRRNSTVSSGFLPSPTDSAKEIATS